LLFTEDPLGHRITIVNSRGDEVAAISTPVGPLDTDRAGNLFVAPNQNYGDFVAVYAPPYTAKRTLIKLPGQLVLDVAVDHRSGNFAVVSTSAQPGGGRSRISFYKRGDIVPCNVLEQPSDISTFFASAAFDQEGKLFFAVGLPGGVATLAESAGQCAASNIQLLSFRDGLQIDLAMNFNRDDQLVIEGRGTERRIYTFAQPRYGIFDQPIYTTILQRDDKFVPLYFTLSSDGHHIWGGNPNVNLYRYPQGGAPIRSISAHDPVHATVFPPAGP
jgi:hypothetical protein